MAKKKSAAGSIRKKTHKKNSNDSLLNGTKNNVNQSDLRNRQNGSSTSSNTLTTTKISSYDDDTITQSENSIEKEHKKIESKSYSQRAGKKLKDRRRVFFMFGTLLGIIVAFYFGQKSSYLSDSTMRQSFDNLVNFENFQVALDDWKEALPNGLVNMFGDFQTYLTGFDFSKIYPNNKNDLTENFAVGKQLRKELNLTDKHPVVMVPGVITTGLESWGLYGDAECSSEQHFRKRLWGSFYMLKTMVLDKVCWLKHIKLDPITGLDPPNFKLRAAQGFEATDFFVAGYWIWNKILQNLGAIGYDPNKMVTAAYDWRLAYLDLEKRDKYFSKLKEQIEVSYELTGEKSVIFGHSMGAQVVFYFLKWVEAEGEHYGNGGSDWCNKYIDTVVDIAGSTLGAPKSVPALISGEMKDTVQLNAVAVYGLEKFFSRRERLDMLRTFGGIPSMLPKGGNMLWGDIHFSKEDELHNNTDTFGNFIRFVENKALVKNNSDFHSSVMKHNFTMKDALNYIIENSPSWLHNRIDDQYSYGFAKTEKELQENVKHHSHWSNPLEVPLPNAPDMKIVCLYGVGNPTERAYVYTNEDYNTTGMNITIAYDQEQSVFFTDGDGTIPLLSHSMCHKWKQGKSAYNPGGLKVKVVELKHEPNRFDIRGGAKSAEHVDILGSAELNDYLLKIASGHNEMIEERVITNISRWVDELNFPL
ncbi:related to Phospholipid:diacylglycerol acyltransferase [Saccharomycodes ludwigii]|uniref:Related to Phospholipid:diacylglycerol acyltransferase n=1 Tax=Saccharomycodes ludwigii TaxID=36035 RepID=A0A376B2J0_9ASCO|nr:related to Phospholipid:diacylglycerol acyltransferase [Saccharomycodes ludwigii]